MSVFLKCKMCGGDLRIISGLNIAECEYCGTRQSVPRTPDERKTSYFNRANEARRANEFDKAIGIYESIVAEYPDEAEAYWGLCLCKFGIEYVDDPKTGRKIPTCHRTVFDSVFEDKDYLAAISHGDADQSRVYKQEASIIDRIQKTIIQSVNIEKPYDVFICYKESDEVTGQRTRDSVLAQDVYDRLVSSGYRTFFAKISLEDKVGSEYEPYIFSALYSAKVMIVIGTSGANLNAVWVRNEWSRFLSLMKKDISKVLLPCYMDMNPGDMPAELASLQAYDMSAMGFIQDLLRGVSKIIGSNKPIATNSSASAGSNAEKLIKRGMLAVESKEWKQAEKYFEQALNDDPESSEAYWGKVLCEKKAGNPSDLLKTSSPLNDSDNYLRALRFADTGFKRELLEYEKKIQRRISVEKERKRRKGKIILLVSIALILCIAIVFAGLAAYKKIYIPSQNYKNACDLYNTGDYAGALSLFEGLGTYKDSPEWTEKCKNVLNADERDQSKNGLSEIEIDNNIKTEDNNNTADDTKDTGNLDLNSFTKEFYTYYDAGKYKEAKFKFDSLKRDNPAIATEFLVQNSERIYNDALKIIDYLVDTGLNSREKYNKVDDAWRLFSIVGEDYKDSKVYLSIIDMTNQGTYYFTKEEEEYLIEMGEQYPFASLVYKSR